MSTPKLVDAYEASLLAAQDIARFAPVEAAGQTCHQIEGLTAHQEGTP